MKMTNKYYTGLNKKAFFKQLANSAANTATKLGEKATGAAYTSLLIGAPTLLATAAWMLYKMQSPKAVADNATEYAINALETESLLQSMRDLDEEKLRGKLKGSRKRYHDQFLG